MAATALRNRARRPASVAEPLEPRRLLAAFNAAIGVAGVGTNLRHVATADFNNDGFGDFAAVNLSSPGSVAVRLGSATPGTFTSAANVGVGDFPIFVTAADFNNDGYADLATANNLATGTVSVALGTGGGTFGAATSFQTFGSGPIALTTGDFNNDGKLDLVCANYNAGGSLSVLPGNGTGGFTGVTAVNIGANPYEVAAADFNTDGKLDLAATCQGASTVAVVLGTGLGTFGTPTNVAVSGTPAGLALGDFNNDAQVDLACTIQGSANVAVALGNGNGTFGAVGGVSVGSSPTGIVAADFDGDGKTDLATASASGNGVSYLAGSGSGTFAAVQTFSVAPSSAFALAVGDFNADTRPDLVVTSNSGSAVTILPGNGVGVFAPASPATVGVGANPWGVFAADFNGDGHPDLATADDNATGSLSIRLGDGLGGFAATAAYATGSFAEAVVAGDFNGDGKKDLAVTRFVAAGTVTVFLGNGDGTFVAQTPVAAGDRPYDLVTADFNADGKTDFAVANGGSGNVSILIGNGSGGFVLASSPVVGTSPESVRAADFNGDGKTDLATANFAGNSVSILIGLGNGTFAAATTITLANGPDALAVADFNGDGKSDLAVGRYFGRAVSILAGLGNGTFAAARTYAVGRGPNFITAADVDGDGLLDLATASLVGASSGVTVLPGLGGGVFGRAVTYALSTDVATLAVSDFNGDGKADIAATQYGGNAVSILIGQRAYRAASSISVSNGVINLGLFSGNSFTLNYDPILDQVIATGPYGTDRFAAAGLTGLVTYAFSNTVVNFDLGRLGGGRPADLAVVGGSTVTLNTSQHLTSVSNSGRVVLAAGGNKVLVTKSFDSNATIDLNDNAMILDYATPGTTAGTQVRTRIASGRNGGPWTGSGLTSTSAKTNAAKTTTLGYMDASDYKLIYGTNATFLGETLDSTAVVIRYTLYGDADFNRKTDFNDFLRLQTAFGNPGGTFAQGDFNYDGTTDFNDFLVLQTAFGVTL